MKGDKLFNHFNMAPLSCQKKWFSSSLKSIANSTFISHSANNWSNWQGVGNIWEVKRQLSRSFLVTSVPGPAHGQGMTVPLKWSQIQFWIVIRTVGTPNQQWVHFMVTREVLGRGSLKPQRSTVSQPSDEMPFQKPQPSDQVPVQMSQPNDQMPFQMQQEFLTASTILPFSYLLRHEVVLDSAWSSSAAS